MSLRNHAVYLFSFTAIFPNICFAAVAFDPVFSNGMVIQRDAPVRLEGTGSPGKKLTIFLGNNSRSSTVGTDGTWNIEFPAVKAGGPYDLKVADGPEAVAIQDVLFGDVWLCSGQSNMQMGLHEAIGGPEAVAKAAGFSKIRILTMGRRGADSPRKNCDAKWQLSTPENVRDFSAVAWFFATSLRADPSLADVPLGIINSSFGGTALEAWTPADALPSIPKDQISASMFNIPAGSLYNGMISPLTGLRLKGALWYQGEANAGHPEVYAQLLENLMDQWRKNFQQPELPFFIVQLPSFDGTMGGLDFSWLREAQAAACEATSNAWVAVTHDTTSGRDLHPVEKQEMGRRLSLLALRGVYGSRLVASGPVLKGAKIEGNRMRVELETADGLSTSAGESLSGFAIAGEDGDYRYTQGKIEGSSVVLENSEVPKPKTVRYGWGAVPDANLVNRSGLPALPFRTDKFPPGRTAFQQIPATRKIDAPLYQLVTGEGGQIASLIVRGKQFLSNENGGGTRLPDGFGARNFGITEDLGPRRLRMSDNSGSLELACSDDSMEWILRNDRENTIEFHIALNPLAKATRIGDSVEISRDDVKLTLVGIDRVEGSTLIAKIQPHSTIKIHLRLLP